MRATSDRICGLDSDWTSIDDECDLIEDLLGLAFVAAQTFITHFRTRFIKLSEACRESGTPLPFGTSKTDFFTRGTPLAPGSNWTPMQVVNAVANYWKHHDEWMTASVMLKNNGFGLEWDTSTMKSSEKQTVEIVESIGMEASSTGNIRTAAKAIGITDSFNDLSPLRER